MATIRKLLNPQTFAGAYSPWTSGSSSYAGDENPAPDDAMQPAPANARSGVSLSPAFNPNTSGQPDVTRDIYQPQLRDISARLSEAYNPPEVGVGGTIRHVLGAIMSQRNPQLGSIISGDYQRQRQIAGLTKQYGLTEDAIKQDQAQKLAALNAQNIGSEITHRTAQEGYWDKLANAKENPPAKTPDEQTFESLTAGGMKPLDALEKIKNTKETDTKGGTLTDLDIGGQNHKVLVDTKTGAVIRDMGKSKLPVPPTASGDKAFESENAKQVTKDLVTARGADFRLRSMNSSYKDATEKNDQQAMLNLLTNHIGMTLGLQKGARITKDILHEATASAPWLQTVAAKFDSDGYLSGVVLTKPQMDSMMKLAHAQRHTAWQQAHDSASQAGLTDKVQFPKDFSPEGDTPASGTGGLKIIRDANGRITGVQ